MSGVQYELLEPAPEDEGAGGRGGAPEPPAGRDPLALLSTLLTVDASRRGSAGIRISLAPRAPEPPPLAGSATDPLRALDYAIVDVETTGAPARLGHRVTEIAALRIRGDGTLVDEYSTLINPERPIPPFITALTNITWEMVADAPRFGEVAERLRRVLDGAVFVAHNAAFDRGFVEAEFARVAGGPVVGRMLCTVRMARRLVPEIPRRSLDALCVYFNVANQARHRAHGDARATVAVFRRLLERAEEREVRSWAELDTLLRRRRARRRRRRASPAPVADP